MKVDLHCPRCHAHAYHWVRPPNPDDLSLVDVPLQRWPADRIPHRVMIDCASCGHSWRGQLSRVERGYDS
jgi:hypothetical protein